VDQLNYALLTPALQQNDAESLRLISESINQHFTNNGNDPYNLWRQLSYYISFNDINQNYELLRKFLTDSNYTPNLNEDLVLDFIINKYSSSNSFDPETNSYWIERSKQLDNDLISQKMDALVKYWDYKELPDMLHIYHEDGHAFVGLSCRSCFEGEPALIHAGLYPSSFEDFECPAYNQENQLSEDDKGTHITIEAFIKYVFDLEVNNNESFNYTLTFDGPTILSNNYFSSDYIKTSELDARKSFNITSDKAAAVFTRIQELSTNCVDGYAYESLSNNCLDFAQQMYNLAGLEGDHFYELYDGFTPNNDLGYYRVYSEASKWVQENLINPMHNLLSFEW
jgi:hypothetical protein